MHWPSVTKIKDYLRDRRNDALERSAERARNDSPAIFVGVTGSSAKSTTAGLLAHILSARSRVLQQVKFNDRRAVLKTVGRSRRRYGFVVIEAGVGSAGQMKPMAEAFRPDVAVVTMVAIEHKSAFGTLEAIAAEKAELVAAMQPQGLAVLNGDDRHVAAMAAKSSGRVVRFGRSTANDYRATDVRAAFPDRLRMTACWRGRRMELRTNFVGEHFWLPTLAAVATAIELGMEPEVVAQRVASFEPLQERCGVIDVAAGPTFVLDTTKAPWHSIGLAFAVVAGATVPRKRIVLGHLSDFAGSDQKYRDAYRLARAAADEVIFVGRHSHRSKASQEDCEEGRFVAFGTTADAAAYIRATAIPGELILLKGSVDLHLERIALAWKVEVNCWTDSCGHNSGCLDCGRYRDSFEWHKGRKKRILRRFSSMPKP